MLLDVKLTPLQYLVASSLLTSGYLKLLSTALVKLLPWENEAVRHS